MLTSTLKQIGLSEKEARVYLACLELGETAIKDIARVSGIKRTTIYDIIGDMVEAGFIRVTARGKKKRFVAIEPEDLSILIKKREALLAQILPELNLINNVAKTKPKVWFFEGEAGLKKVYTDTLRDKDITVYQWASRDMLDAIGLEWSENYMKRRAGKKIKALTIAADAPEIRKLKEKEQKHYREIKIIDPEKFPFKVEIDVYGDRIAMISAPDRMGVIVESKPIAATLKSIFELCWSGLK